MAILITGGAGYIGSVTTDLLRSRGEGVEGVRLRQITNVDVIAHARSILRWIVVAGDYRVSLGVARKTELRRS